MKKFDVPLCPPPYPPDHDLDKHESTLQVASTQGSIVLTNIFFEKIFTNLSIYDLCKHLDLPLPPHYLLMFHSLS